MNQNDADIRATVVDELEQVAPDIDPAAGDHGANLFDEFDIDSIDFRHLIARLSERYGVPMPECDYPRMQSVDALVAYLADVVGRGEQSAAPV